MTQQGRMATRASSVPNILAEDSFIADDTLSSTLLNNSRELIRSIEETQLISDDSQIDILRSPLINRHITTPTGANGTGRHITQPTGASSTGSHFTPPTGTSGTGTLDVLLADSNHNTSQSS